MKPSNLERLWQIANNDLMHFEPVGLILHEDIQNEGYGITPKNSLAFARTGGDGNHFSFICNGEPTDESPVVMTVPMNDENIIVGENLVEFLALGCRYGYFALEQLSYAYEDTVMILDQKKFWDDYENYQKDLLYKISETFSVKPWNNTHERLQELKSRYFDLLIIE